MVYCKKLDCILDTAHRSNYNKKNRKLQVEK